MTADLDPTPCFDPGCGCCAGYKWALEQAEAKTQALVDWAAKNGHLGEGRFTFEDGDTWKATSWPE